MNSMLLSLFMASVLAQQPAPKAQAPAAPAVQETPVSANVKLRIGTSTYFPDGRVLTTSANDWPLAINKKIVAFTGGKSMCEPRAAGLDRPELPASGWQIEFTPIREAAGELEVLVSWRSLGLAKQATFDRIRVGNGTTLKLHAGDRIVLDHMPSPLTGSPYFLAFRGVTPRIAPTGTTEIKRKEWTATGYRVATVDARSCDAIGMSLEVGLEPAKTEAIVEAELWLVRPNRDGTELSERQVLRLPIGQPASSYYFDEARLVAAPADSRAPYAKVSGELAAFAVENGKIHFNFKVARRYELKAPTADATSSYRDLVATPGEVLAFQLPAMDTPLSVRLRAQVLK